MTRVGRAVTGLAAAAICGLTLVPSPSSAPSVAATPLYCLVCGDRGGADVALNILLFIPFGFGLRLTGSSWKRPVVNAGILSLTIELLQLTVVPGRDASLSDVITNTVGAALGALMASQLVLLLRPTVAQARRLLITWAIALAVLAAAATWLETPDTGNALVTEWGGRQGPEVFGGRVVSVVLDGVRVAPGESRADSARLSRSLLSGKTTLEAKVITGTLSHHRRWIYRIGPRYRPNGHLSQQGRAAVLALPARSLRLRLNPPSMILPGGFPADSGVAVVLHAEQRHGTMRITSAYQGQRHALAVGLSPAAAWVLFAPFGLALGGATRLVTAGVIVVLLAPLGYWSRASRSRRLASGIQAAVLVAGLVAIPRLGGLPPVHWSEWLAGVAGLTIGWAVFPPGANLHSRCGSPSTSEFSSS